MKVCRPIRLILLLLVSFHLSPSKIHAKIHSAPIVLIAKQLGIVQYYRLNQYRLFRTDEKGVAHLIPFQIDERDEWGDYILPKGKNPNQKFSNEVFDFLDEICLMGNDVGFAKKPSIWKVKKPNRLFEVKFTLPKTKKIGALYIGIYDGIPPAMPQQKYVIFNLQKSFVDTSRYFYQFNSSNYLVVKNVSIKGQKKQDVPFINKSVFSLRADLKYLPTITINHDDIESDLDSYKDGPIRTITRVNFNYSLLRLKFALGMYTEVSFFSNAVLLPAIIDSPIDGKKTLNRGSFFYYGFALEKNPSKLKISTNMDIMNHSSKGKHISVIKATNNPQKDYSISAESPQYMFSINFTPSKEMLKENALPKFYIRDVEAAKLREKKAKGPIDGNKVNIAVAFDMTSLKKAMHEVSLSLFIENRNSPQIKKEWLETSEWIFTVNLVPFL